MATASADAEDVRQLVARIEAELPESTWSPRPAGWPDQIELAILDSVFSLRARYGGPENGVRGLVKRWLAHRGVERADDVVELAALASTGDRLAEILGSGQTLSGGDLKALGAAKAAAALQRVEVRQAADVTGSDEQRRAWMSVRGLGEASWSYFLMLLGMPGVKADTMVTRFVSETLDNRKVSPAEAHAVVSAAAPSFEGDLTALDHAIWSWQRAKR